NPGRTYSGRSQGSGGNKQFYSKHGSDGISGSGQYSGQYRSYRGHRGDGDGHRHHRGTRFIWGGLPFYYDDGYYYGDCEWLHEQAVETGS
ncbi:hypothetical protein ACSTJA_23430, partial [Vibrio parahaemolyticus]